MLGVSFTQIPDPQAHIYLQSNKHIGKNPEKTFQFSDPFITETGKHHHAPGV